MNFYGQCHVTGGGSEEKIDKILFDRYFKEKTDGFFIECGANDGAFLSNCRCFEEIGWKGINVEASKSLYSKLVEIRPKAINLNVALSNTNSEIDFEEVAFDNGGFSRVAASKVDHVDRLFGLSVSGAYKIRSITYETMIKEHGVTGVDLFSLDTENHELEIIEGMGGTMVLPKVFCVEHTHVGLDKLKGVLGSFGYVFDWSDSLNSVFLL